MEPLDWEKVGMPDAPKKTAREATAQEEAVDFMWPLDAGVPCDALVEEVAPLTKGEEVIALNVMTAKARGVDMVNLPPHYARFKIEPIRFIGENKLDWFQGNIVKYVCRHDAKNGLEDIAKVIRYANMYDRYLRNDPDWWRAGKPEDFKV